MKIFNPQIVKAPLNWIFVAVVLVFVILVTYHFSGILNAPNSEN